MRNESKLLIRRIKKLLERKKFNKAEKEIESGLKDIPNQFDLLVTATDFYKAFGDREKSLRYSEILIDHYPDKWQGYARTAKDLIALKQFEKEQKIINKGLKRLNNETRLLRIQNALNFESFRLGKPLLLQDPSLIRKVDLKDLRLPQCQLLSNICFDNTPSKHENLSKVQPFQENSISLLVFNECLATRAPGLHSISGVPFNHSIPVRGNLKNLSDFPIGFFEQIAPSPSFLDSSAPQDIGFYVPYLNFRHFGHYLTETASSLSLLLSLRKLGITIPSTIPIITEGGEVNRIARIIGVDSNQIRPKKSIKSQLHFKLLISSTPTTINRKFTSVAHQEAVRLLLKYDKKVSNKDSQFTIITHKKVYISRSQIESSKRLLKDELLLEKHLSERGWFIFHPQKYNIEDQIKIYENSEFICSQYGSAIHLLFAVDTQRLKKFVLLKRSHAADSYTRQFDAQGICFTCIPCLTKDILCKKQRVCQDLTLKSEFSFENLALEIERQVRN